MFRLITTLVLVTSTVVECAFLGNVCDICTCLRNQGSDSYEKILANCTLRPRIAKMITEIENNPESYNLQVVMQHMNLTSLQRNEKFEKLNVTELYLDFNSIRGLPSYQFSQYVNLTILSLSNNEIETISDEAFIGLEKMEVLNLSRNALQTFDILYLQSARSLLKLDLSSNSIFVISPSVSLKQPSLVYLDLSANKITEFPVAAFESLVGLTFLNFSKNSLKMLPSGALEKQKHLLKLDLSYNQLKELGPDVFGEDNVITWLTLQHNLLSNVSFITELQYLSFIDLSFNSLVEFNLSDNSSVRFLLVGNNSLTSIDSIINYLPKVEKIDASWNQISQLPKSTGSSLKTLIIDDSAISSLQPRLPGSGSLQYLSLSNLKHLKKLPWNAFPLLFNNSNGACNTLKLTNNGLKTIEKSALKNLNICELDLSGNQLTSLTEDVFDWDIMEKINLQNNPWHCSCQMQSLLNRIVTKLYDTQQELLEELRCSTPEDLAGTRLVHWYNRSEASICVKNKRTSNEIKLVSSAAMILIDLVLGIIVVTLVITGFYLQRKAIRERRSKRNRRF